jgi:hypothetical protein
MNIVVLKRKKGCSGLVTLSKTRLFSLVFSIFIVVPASAIYLGYHWGVADMQANPDNMRVAMQTELDSQRLKISEVTRTAEENMNALAMRLGKLQAHVIRRCAGATPHTNGQTGKWRIRFLSFTGPRWSGCYRR